MQVCREKSPVGVGSIPGNFKKNLGFDFGIGIVNEIMIGIGNGTVNAIATGIGNVNEITIGIGNQYLSSEHSLPLEICLH